MAGLGELLEQLARAGASVHLRQGRLGLTPQAVLVRFAEPLKEHKAELLKLAEAEGGHLTPERLAALAREFADCPVHWTRVPELPGQQVRMVDEDGFGTLYRVLVRGQWYLLKFLPPFDGRCSVMDTSGQARVLAGVEEALRVLEALAENQDRKGALNEEKRVGIALG